MAGSSFNLPALLVLLIAVGTGIYLVKIADQLDKAGGINPVRPPPPNVKPLPPAPVGPPTPTPPAPTKAVPGFTPTIHDLFRAVDQQAMKFMFDLWSYADVKANGPAILMQVKSGAMPCKETGGTWTADMVATFQSWVDGGMPETAIIPTPVPPPVPPPPSNVPVWDPTIKSLFRPQDIAQVKSYVDLTSYGDVKAKASLIMMALQSGKVPADGPWPQAKMQLFEDWAGGGFPEK